MKVKEVFYLLGLKPRTKVYGHRIDDFHLAKDGLVRFAQWTHPREVPKEITQEAVDELRRYLQPGDTAIDIGAHTGDTSVPMALAVGREGCVLGLEPNRYVFAILEENARLNTDKTRIVPLMIAATPTDGEFEFEYSDSGFCNGGLHEGISKWRHGHAFKLKVDGRYLPTYLEREYPSEACKTRLVKVDAEGYDASILESLDGFLAQTRPFIRAEVFKQIDGPQRAKLYDAIAKHGYDVHRIESDAQYQGQKLQPKDMMSWRHFDVFGVPR